MHVIAAHANDAIFHLERAKVGNIDTWLFYCGVVAINFTNNDIRNTTERRNKQKD